MASDPIASQPQTTSSELPQVASVQAEDYRVVINRGASHKIRQHQRFLIFGKGEEIFDPKTRESLGQLEVVRGTGTVIHVQDQIATIESDAKWPGKKVTRFHQRRDRWETVLNPWSAAFRADTEVEEEPPERLPFDHPQVGDFARPI